MPRLPSFGFNTFIDRVIRQLEPGSEDAIFPRFIEENAIFTFAGRPTGLEWRLGSMRVQSFTSAAGVANIEDAVVQATGLRYYHAISAFHSDPVSRRMDIVIRDTTTGAVAAIAHEDSLATLDQLVVNRPIVIGETHVIRATVNTIAAGDQVTLRTYSGGRGLGAELPAL